MASNLQFQPSNNDEDINSLLLRDVPFPEDGETTLCELSYSLMSIPHDAQKQTYSHKEDLRKFKELQGSKYSTFKIEKYPGDDYLPVPTALESSDSDSLDDTNDELSFENYGGYLSNIMSFLKNIANRVAPTVVTPRPKSNYPITAMAWHQCRDLVALCTTNYKGKSTISVYGMDGTVSSESPFLYPYLDDGHQTNVECMQWKPLSGRTLAVGCESGVILWEVSLNRLDKNESTSRRLMIKDNAPVTSLQFSPDGRLLATASTHDSTVVIWDIATERPTCLRRSGGPISCLSWSPNSQYLFTGYTNNAFRIWTTHDWQSVKWGLSGPCKKCCWSQNSKFALFIAEGQNLLYSLCLSQPKSIQATCHVVADLSLDQNTCVDDIFWDTSSERLAVTFIKKKKSSLMEHDNETDEGIDNQATKSIALIHTRLPFKNLDSDIQTNALGWISGPALSHKVGTLHPTHCSFLNWSEKGTILSICWQDSNVENQRQHEALISFVPLFFG